MRPEDYKIYTLPVGEITRNHGLVFHGYADDSNNYTSFSLKNRLGFENALQKVSDSTSEIKAWMTLNKLKLNDIKTEVLVIVPPTKSPQYKELKLKWLTLLLNPPTQQRALDYGLTSI